MFPPTISAAPTSEMTAPKPAIAAASSGRRASTATVHSERSRPAPSACICTRKSGSTCWSAAVENPATSGSEIAVCAITIAVGVYSRPRPPSGPERHSRIVTTRPTTIGGTPMPVLTSASAIRRPRNRPNASNAATGSPSSSARTVAVIEILSDRPMISQVCRVAGQQQRERLAEGVHELAHVTRRRRSARRSCRRPARTAARRTC